MKPEEYQELHDQICQGARVLTKAKGHDYSGEEDTLRNLKSCEAVGICPAPKGVLVRLQDKLNRLAQLSECGDAGAAVKDESIRDTVLDVVNYTILFYALLVERGTIANPSESASDANSHD